MLDAAWPAPGQRCPSAMTGSGELLEVLPRHQTAHASLLTYILDLMHGSSLTPEDRHPSPPAEELSPGGLGVLRYRPLRGGPSCPRAAASRSRPHASTTFGGSQVMSAHRSASDSSSVDRAPNVRSLTCQLFGSLTCQLFG